MNSLREVMIHMSSTRRPLSTKKRWIVINKKIVFSNGIIPFRNEYFGDSITHIETYVDKAIINEK